MMNTKTKTRKPRQAYGECVMSLVKVGQGVTDIRGGLGGVYFSRDRSGLHVLPKPRRVKQRTPAQNTQRSAFTIARSFSKINRTVSYNIYRALNNLAPKQPPTDYSVSKL